MGEASGLDNRGWQPLPQNPASRIQYPESFTCKGELYYLRQVPHLNLQPVAAHTVG